MNPRFQALIDDVYRALHPNDVVVQPTDVQAARPGSQFNPLVVPTTTPTQQVSAKRDNNIRVLVFSAFNATLKITGRVRKPDGSTIPIGPEGKGFDFQSIGDRLVRQFDFAIGDATIEGFNVTTSTAAIPINALWVTVQETRTLVDESVTVTSTFVSGAVNRQQPIGWPGSGIRSSVETGGYLRNVTGTTPGVGHEIVESVPTGARWEINSMRWGLQDSGVPGNRESDFQQQAGGTVRNMLVLSNLPQGPGGGVIGYQWGQGLPIINEITTTSGMTGPLPFNRAMNAGDTFGSFTFNFDAGDQYSNVTYVVRETLDPQ